MNIQISPFMIISALVIGALSAYLAYKRERNPYIWFAVGFLFGILGIFAIFFISGKKKAKAPLKPEPVIAIHGPKDKFWYYLDPTNQQQGPMSHDALTAAWKGGKLDLSTLVWNEDLPNWQPLTDVVKLEGA